LISSLTSSNPCNPIGVWMCDRAEEIITGK
jgi:hypothetical protein